MLELDEEAAELIEDDALPARFSFDFDLPTVATDDELALELAPPDAGPRGEETADEEPAELSLRLIKLSLRSTL